MSNKADSTGNAHPVAGRLEQVSIGLGRVVSWAVLLLILVEFALVLMSSVFYVGSIRLQESTLYLNSLVFLTAAGYTLARDDHVRVDILYRNKSAAYRQRVDFWGTLLLLFPVLGLLYATGLPFITNSWAVLEGSTETSGLPLVFLLKSMLLLFAVTLSLQGFATLIRNWPFGRTRQEG